MIVIAHRGNTTGPNEEHENNPDYLLTAIRSGYHVETDIWLIDDTFYLGHDGPQYKVSVQFLDLISPKSVFHCKNIPALHTLLKEYPSYHCFFHNEDACTLTSLRHIWTYPGQQLTSSSICVMPERVGATYEEVLKTNCIGVCTDYPGLFLNR